MDDPRESAVLQVDELTVNFGGVAALDRVSFSAASSAITGLIGPNGAGKTTTFNACSGLVRTIHGTVRLGGIDLAPYSVEERARLGLGRTFQRMELATSLSARVNIAVGVEAALAAARPDRQLRLPVADRAAVAARTDEAIERCDLAKIADVSVGSLSTGQRRLVELARAIAARFRFLLLDEPSSGLDREETARFGEILTDTAGRDRIGILLVEHDMDLVMSTCSLLHVLDFGTRIFSGTPAEAQASAVVRAAYLGVDA